MELVEVKMENVYCDSLMVSRKFKQKHAYVVNNIKKLLSDLETLRVGTTDPKKRYTIITEDREYRGRPYTAYLMDRQFFSLLANRFRGKHALEWQIKFNDAFYEMEEKIISSNNNKLDKDWTSSRDESKIARRSETDVIKEFVEYATDQGSKSAKFYYKHITNATYEALGLMAQKQPKLRDSMNIYEVSQLILSEKLAREKIKEYMGLGRNYKDIYQSVRSDLIEYSNLLRIE
jgi:phage regulator Rha-like protein